MQMAVRSVPQTKGSFFVKPFPATSGALTITAPARLHLGFLDLNGSLGRHYGSIGIAIDRPSTVLKVTKASANSAIGPESERVLKLLEKFTGDGNSGTYAIDVA